MNRSGIRSFLRVLKMRSIMGRKIIEENQDFDREGDLSLLHVFFKDTTMIK